MFNSKSKGKNNPNSVLGELKLSDILADELKEVRNQVMKLNE